MSNTDILEADVIGVIRSYYLPELHAVGISYNNAGISLLYKEYTGCGYKPHKKRIYNVIDDPYIIHSGMRVHLSEFTAVSDNNGFVIPEGCGLILHRTDNGFTLSH